MSGSEENFQHSPLTRYLAFRQAVVEWVEENSNRFVCPSAEHWPENVDNRRDALDHYGEEAADDILELYEENLTGGNDE